MVTLDRLWLLALIPALALSARAPRRGTAHSRRLAGALILYTTAFGLRALLTPVHSLGAVKIWLDDAALPLVLFLFARRYITTQALVLSVLKALTPAGVVAATIALDERLIGFDLSSLAGGSPFVDPAVGLRYSGPCPEPEILAVCLLVSLAATLGWAQVRKQRFRGVIPPLLLLELAGISITYFRSAYVGAALVIVIALGLRPRRGGRLFTGAIVVGSITAGVVLKVTQNSSAILGRLTNVQNVNGRFADYTQGVSLFGAHMLTGVGVDRYGSAAQALNR